MRRRIILVPNSWLLLYGRTLCRNIRRLNRTTMHPILSQRQRLAAAAVYLALLWVLFGWLQSHYPSIEGRGILWFYSGALMIVLGRYVVEPYFTTPADAIVNALALLVTLSTLSAQDRSALVGYKALDYYGLAVIGAAITTIALKDSLRPRLQRAARLTFGASKWLGKSQVMFSALYLAASWSFFAVPELIGLFVASLAVWICIAFFDVAGRTISEIGKLFAVASGRSSGEIGHAIGCDNPLLYNVEVDYAAYRGPELSPGTLVAIETRANTGAAGVIIERKQLLGKSWLSVYLLEANGQIATIDLQRKTLVDTTRSVLAGEYRVYQLDPAVDLDTASMATITSHPLFAHHKTLAGCRCRLKYQHAEVHCALIC